jgi:hypothetical protein
MFKARNLDVIDSLPIMLAVLSKSTKVEMQQR